jgi:hypothetical protein
MGAGGPYVGGAGRVGDGVGLGVGEPEGVDGVGLGVGEPEGVDGVGVGVGDPVGDGEPVGAGVGVAVSVGVGPGPGLSVGGVDIGWLPPRRRMMRPPRPVRIRIGRSWAVGDDR